MEVPAKDIGASFQISKQGRVIVKFLRRKDCEQVHSVKNDIQKSTATDLDFPNTTIKLYLNESLCPYYRILWSTSKALFTKGKIHSYFIWNGSVKIRLKGKGLSIPITHTADFEMHFPAVDLSAPR